MDFSRFDRHTFIADLARAEDEATADGLPELKASLDWRVHMNASSIIRSTSSLEYTNKPNSRSNDNRMNIFQLPDVRATLGPEKKPDDSFISGTPLNALIYIIRRTCLPRLKKQYFTSYATIVSNEIDDIEALIVRFFITINSFIKKQFTC